jgi:hypothetical protein
MSKKNKNIRELITSDQCIYSHHEQCTEPLCSCYCHNLSNAEKVARAQAKEDAGRAATEEKPMPDAKPDEGEIEALKEQLYIEQRERGATEDQLDDAEAVILRAYYYHKLHAEELKDWLTKAGIEPDAT